MLMERDGSEWSRLNINEVLPVSNRFELSQLEPGERCHVITDEGELIFVLPKPLDHPANTPAIILESSIAPLETGEQIQIEGAEVQGFIAQGTLGLSFNLRYTKFKRYYLETADYTAMGDDVVDTARRSGTIRQEGEREYIFGWDMAWRNTTAVRDVYRYHEGSEPVSVFE